MRTSYFTLILILTVMITASCIQTPMPEVPKRVNFGFLVANMGDTLIVDQDSISVEQVKFLSDKINLQLPDGVILQTGVDALIFNYQASFNGRVENVLSANIGFEDIDSFSGIELFIAPPKENDDVSDTDFFGISTNYSVIISGSFNNQSFNFKTDISIEKSYDFGETIKLNNDEETLIILFRSNIENIFISQEDGSILDPTIENNNKTINVLFQESLQIEASAGDELF